MTFEPEQPLPPGLTEPSSRLTNQVTDIDKEVAETATAETLNAVAAVVSSRPKVMEVPGTDISKFMALQGTPRRQSMQGFDSDYVDIVDYIVRLTHRIWEERNLGLLYTAYAHNIMIHTSEGMVYGRDKVMADSVKSMAAYPDVRIYADEVIWTGNDRDGFHTSHRGVWAARNTGYSNYGPPTGRQLVRRSVAHCIIKENYIVEEWITRDELAVVWQLGFDAVELARKMAARDAAAGIKSPVPVGTGEVDRLEGQTTPAALPAKPTEFEIEAFVRRTNHEIWNWRMFGKVRDYYVANYDCSTTGNRTLHGWGDLEANIIQMLAAFPDGRKIIDHVCWMGDAQAGYRVAVRWYFQGTHLGPGFYGEPTGKRVKIIGVSHYLIQKGKFVKEWTQFDEFALLKQIYWPI